MSGLRREEVEQFCTAVVSRLGFCVDDHNRDHVEEVLRRRIRQAGCDSAASYLQRLDDDRFAREELREVAVELSVPETYFFRHPEQFRALAEAAVPERMGARQRARQLRVLSAGCASGEEPYSVAAVLQTTRAAAEDWDMRIVAIDINRSLLEKAEKARYGPWSLRAANDEQKQRYFQREGEDYLLHEDLRRLVSFQERNLLDDDPAFWQAARFDFVFCRNVMIYLTPAAVRQVAERLAWSLVPGGFLFLGPSETLRGITQEFHLRHSHGAFYYQRRHSGEMVEHAAVWSGRAAPTTARGTPEACSAGISQDSWMTAISGAAHRIAALAARSQRQSPEDLAGGEQGGDTPAPIAAGSSPLELARELLRQERFEEALHELDAPKVPSAPDADTLLLRAVLLANKAEMDQAVETCQRILALDELHAGAHYLMAVCREHAGDVLAAAEYDQRAIYLDPEFAMPHLHLGRLARRLGDQATARRELNQALELLAGEDASRILLFGGGFQRAALVRYCQSQLRHCGGGDE